jgi:hypothetical protein
MPMNRFEESGMIDGVYDAKFNRIMTGEQIVEMLNDLARELDRAWETIDNLTEDEK